MQVRDNLSQPKALTQAKPVTINPVAALLALDVLLVLIVMAGAMIWDPETFYTHNRQLQFMFGLGLFWLCCVFVREKEE